MFDRVDISFFPDSVVKLKIIKVEYGSSDFLIDNTVPNFFHSHAHSGCMVVFFGKVRTGKTAKAKKLFPNVDFSFYGSCRQFANIDLRFKDNKSKIIIVDEALQLSPATLHELFYMSENGYRVLLISQCIERLKTNISSLKNKLVFEFK